MCFWRASFILEFTNCNCTKKSLVFQAIYRTLNSLLLGLALIYKKYLSDPANQPEATKKAIKWIKDKIMHTHFMKDIEDR